MERAVSAHFIFAFNPSPITILAIHKSQEITYSIQAPTALSLPCLSTHMFRKVSQTVPIFCFYRTENIPLVPSMFYLCLTSRSFPNKSASFVSTPYCSVERFLPFYHCSSIISSSLAALLFSFCLYCVFCGACTILA